MPGRSAAIIAAMLLVPAPALAHAALLKSDPKPGSTVAAGIRAIRLEFSEEVVPDLCHVAIVDATGHTTDLRLSSDPNDVRVIVAPVNELGPGVYRVNWHAVSSDGHPVAGKFGFAVAGGSTPVTGTIAAVTLSPVDHSRLSRGETNAYPAGAALARGTGVTALLVVVGLLAFALRSPRRIARRLPGILNMLAAIGSFALLVNLFLWARYVEPGGTFAGANWVAMLRSVPGRMELLRTAASIVALLMLWPLRKWKPSLAFSLAAILISAAIGHPASTRPILSVPLIAVHLLAIAAWSGGVTWLIVLSWSGERAISDEAQAVSKVAFAAAVLVVATGTAESVLLLTAASDLIDTAYGRLLLAKVAGLAILIAFGWYHRSRAVPRLALDERLDITSSLRYEMAIMTAVILVAGFLSYTPLPR